jgi:hypothetical protein
MFVAAICTGKPEGYGADVIDLVRDRITLYCGPVPGLEVCEIPGGLEVTVAAGVPGAQLRLMEGILAGFSLGYKIGTSRKAV